MSFPRCSTFGFRTFKKVYFRACRWGFCPMSPIDDYVNYCQAAGMSAGTLKVKRSRLKHAERNVDLLTASETDLIDYLAKQKWRAETRRSARSHLRGFYTWATRHGLRADNPSAYLPPVKVPHGKPKPASDGALERALATADVTLRAMLLLAAYAGLRRAEIATLRVADVEVTRIRVTGKGGRVRLVPIHPELHEALQAQIATVWPSEYVFPGRFPGTHIGVYYVWEHIKQATGGAPPHHLRHRFATRAYRHTRDLRAVQELLGHSSPTTTARYVAVDDDAMAAAVMGVAMQKNPSPTGWGGAYSSKYQLRSSAGISSGSRSITALNPMGDIGSPSSLSA